MWGSPSYLSNVEITYDIPTNYVKQDHNPVNSDLSQGPVSAYKSCFTYFKPNKVGIKYKNSYFLFFSYILNLEIAKRTILLN